MVIIQLLLQPNPPVRPVSVYVDPADRVAQTPVKVQIDNIKTWAVSEVDKKGKKKKGTLGIGNGSIFFASESDKVRSGSLQYGGYLFIYLFPRHLCKSGTLPMSRISQLKGISTF